MLRGQRTFGHVPMPSPIPEARGAAAPLSRRTRAIGAIEERIGRLVRARRHGERLEALVALVAWLREPSDVELVGSDTAGEAIAREHAHLALFVAFLERSPEQQSAFATSIGTVLASTNALSLFAESGMRNERGLLVESGDRIARRFLPRPREELDLSSMLPPLCPGAAARTWITTVPPVLFERVCLVSSANSSWQPVRIAMEESLRLLAARVATRGLAPEMRERRENRGVRTSPYHLLSASTSRWLDALEGPSDEVGLREAEAAWSADVIGCRRSGQAVRKQLESTGVSVDIVYALDVIERYLDRMGLIFAALSPAPPAARAGAQHALLRALVQARLDDRSLRALWRDNMALIARKVIERTGETGEHYITTTRKEWALMWFSAAGGGLVTTFTAVLKTWVTHSHLPLFIEFCLAGSNYAISFVLIQMLGFTLATKQPAMTAATLAAILDRGSSAERSEELATHIARIVRSQLAAAFGNIIAVGVGAFIFVRMYTATRGHAFFDQEHVEEVLRSLDPLHSGTVFYAFITGIVLWLSGIVAGWVGNWVVYRRLPQAIAEHRLGDRVGAHRMQAVSRWFASHAAGLAGNAALGFLLALVLTVGKGTGLPLDVRHVTLSSGQLMLAAASQGGHFLQDPLMRRAMLGIAVIFVLNLGTSFLLALAVAARARNATRKDLRDLGSALVRHAIRRPLDFFFPPRASSESPAH
jgi:site-specific recombinase